MDNKKTLEDAISRLPPLQKNRVIQALEERYRNPPVVPDNAIDVSKDIGSVAEQVAGANIHFTVPEKNGGYDETQCGGDCVMSMIFKLKELTDKFGDSVKSHTIINPVLVRMFKGEEFVIHHVVKDTKRNLWIDVSNGRLRMCHPNIYKKECMPPVWEEVEGYTYKQLEKATAGWIKMLCPNITIEKPNVALVYLFYNVVIHNRMMASENPDGNNEMYITSDECKEVLPHIVTMDVGEVIRHLHGNNM